jgi:lipopolysaccharide/colanic/teichoic acid biosynthesis glycosyltransferase
MLVSWFLFRTSLGELPQVFPDLKAGLSVVRAGWLEMQRSDQTAAVGEMR